MILLLYDALVDAYRVGPKVIESWVMYHVTVTEVMQEVPQGLVDAEHLSIEPYRAMMGGVSPSIRKCSISQARKLQRNMAHFTSDHIILNGREDMD